MYHLEITSLQFKIAGGMASVVKTVSQLKSIILVGKQMEGGMSGHWM